MVGGNSTRSRNGMHVGAYYMPVEYQSTRRRGPDGRIASFIILVLLAPTGTFSQVPWHTMQVLVGYHWRVCECVLRCTSLISLMVYAPPRVWLVRCWRVACVIVTCVMWLRRALGVGFNVVTHLKGLNSICTVNADMRLRVVQRIVDCFVL